MPPTQINCVRGVVGVILLFPFIKNEIPRLLERRYLSLWMRSLFGSLSALALFYNVQINGASFAVATGHLSSVFVVIFALTVFRESLKVLEWMGLIVVLTVTFTLGSPLGLEIQPKGTIIGVAGALCAGIGMISLKRAANLFSPLLIVWGFSLLSMITSCVVPGADWLWHWKGILLILLPVALLGLVGQIFLTKSYEYLPAIAASACGLSGILWNISLESLYFSTLPTATSSLSYCALCVGLMLMQVGRKSKKPSTA